MSIQKKEYELSVWSETLGENGQKIEHKEYIIGAHDMDYLGRAINIKLTKKINGTHNLTFQLPDKWYDSEKGDYVRNEFVEQLFNEKKVKLYYMDEWYEFYIKNVQDTKQFKSYMKTYTCSDAFIDELSRNGYGITFDEELYNNVEEIGTFSEEILKDSIWNYSPKNNWGDFTEYLEEKMYKIPISQFDNIISGYELKYDIENVNEEDSLIINKFTNEKRKIEMGDDLASKKYFWDQYNNNGEPYNNFMGNFIESIDNDGYIYIFFSDLDFCFQTTKEGLTATEEVQFYGDHSYALAPKSIDPNALIQFMCFPKNAVIEIDEAGMIVNKNYHYVMTVEQWNNKLEKKSDFFYQFETLDNSRNKNFYSRSSENLPNKAERQLTGNWCVYYEDFLSEINGIQVLTGKKISITDRTEINISKNIDQYVTVYNNNYDNYEYINLDGQWINDSGIDYRVCSKNSTRQIVPQLARNLIENASEIRSTDGWQIASIPSYNVNKKATLDFITSQDDSNQLINFLAISPTNVKEEENKKYNTFINFGIVGQEYEIKKDKIYCLGLYGENFKDGDKIIIGEGTIRGEGEYDIDVKFELPIKDFFEEFNYYLISLNETILKPYFAICLNEENHETRKIFKAFLFEAYTKGIDQFENALYKYSGREFFDKNIIWINQEENKISEGKTEDEINKMIIFENDVMPGDTYSYKEYFIQQIYPKNDKSKIQDTFMTKEFLSPYGNLSENQLPYSSELFSEEDLVISTKYVDLNKCPYYNNNNNIYECDCSYNSDTANKMCVYQKYGYCPYRFQTEKHCRKIRTLKGEKSNRFNLSQEIGKSFEVYPIYYIDHEENGKIKKDSLSNNQIKNMFFIREKGQENKIGFRYEVNLGSISRTVKSDQIVTKLYVNDVDSSISKTGLCSIKTAKNNPTKDNYLLDFSYYIAKGILNKEEVEGDLYGISNQDFGYVKKIGYYNSEYDKLSDLIINLSSQSFVELQANVNTNFQAITTAQQQLQKLKQQQNKYKTKITGQYDVDFNVTENAKLNTARAELWSKLGTSEISTSFLPAKYLATEDYDIFKIVGDVGQLYLVSKGLNIQGAFLGLNPDNYIKNANVTSGNGYLQLLFLDEVGDDYNEAYQELIKKALPIAKLFESKDVEGKPYPLFKIKQNQSYINQQVKIDQQIKILQSLMEELFGKDYMNKEYIGEDIESFSVEEFQKSEFYQNHTYLEGMLGQFNKEYNQIQEWKKKQSMYLKLINSTALAFFKKYEPYLKEGTWSDSNYLTDDAYYFGAKEVSAEGAIPKVEYNISVVDLYALTNNKDYCFNIADTTYIEDIGMFGINSKTGLPNRLKVIISEISYDLDQPKNNSIKVQNFTTQFEDLFQQVSASVQSLSFNENIYKRSSNFTSNQSLREESLQGTLDSNNLTLINTPESNISLDATGQSGSDLNNHSNQYKINGEGMFFSNNGGQSWNIGVGPNGINADYIKVGSLDAGKIKIVDNDYLYFLWDKEGIIAFRDPQGKEPNFNDFAVFNKYGLSLVNSGKIRLRAGYSYTGINGDYSPSDQIGNTIGFYLYDNKGNPIFSTSSDANSARLLLGGEILAVSSADLTQKSEIVYYHALNFNNINIPYIETGDSLEIENLEDLIPIEINFVMKETRSQYLKNIQIYLYNEQKGYRNENTFYIVEDFNENILNLISEDENASSNQLLPSGFGFSYYDADGYLKNTYLNQRYWYNTQNTYYLESRIDGERIQKEQSTGIFISNQLNDLQDSPSLQQDLRIFSCIKFNPEENGQDRLENLFTIYNDGTLLMGGKFLNDDENWIGNIKKVSDVPNILPWDPKSSSNTIRIIDGEIYLGDSTLSNLILSASRSLPSHSHKYNYKYCTYKLTLNGEEVSTIKIDENKKIGLKQTVVTKTSDTEKTGR